MRTHLLLFATLTLFSSITLGATPPPAKTSEFTLDNGLKVFVREDHRAPIFISQIWYKVGSSYEPNGITGISHALEHMMFRGSKHYKDGQFSHLIAVNGGSENAMTSYDFTMYYEQLPADKLELALKLEADRMQHLNLTNATFDKEIEVIKEERRLRVDDNPQALTFERLMAAAHISNPYHNPVIGWMNDLNNLTLDDLKTWYKQWYSPNNAVLVVAGDVSPSHVVELARQYLGHIPKSNLIPPKPRLSVQTLGRRSLQVHRPAKLPWLSMAFNVPVLKTSKESKDVYALAVLSSVLSGGDSARFQSEIQRQQQIASDISTEYSPYQLHDSLFLIEATPAQRHTAQELKYAVLNEIDNIKKKSVTKEELKRIKAKLEAQQIYKRDKLSYQAMEIGHFAILGLPWQESDHFLEVVKSITPEDIVAAAKKYLTTDRLTTAILLPDSLDMKRHGQKRRS